MKSQLAAKKIRATPRYNKSAIGYFLRFSSWIARKRLIAKRARTRLRPR
jgi:hypothetical protein